ncbi:hypothetical protein JCM24511_01412 [Saitozyma sp. JCM 24511]|nr:hypothetical protein JCM24511_01412 [Saitozyma sp. JCM 24511]
MALHRNIRRLLSSPRARSGTALRVLFLLLVASALTLIFGRNHGLLQFRRRALRRHHLLLSTPDDRSEPFRLVTIDNGNITDVKSVPLENRREEQTSLFNTHIVRHPDPHRSDEYFVAQEVHDGQILRVKLVDDDYDESVDQPHQPRLEVVQAEFTKGASPAYTLVTRDRKALLCAHFMSPRVSALQVEPLKRLSTLELPIPRHVESHPHQVVQHPRIANRFYIPDLGANKVHEVVLGEAGLAYRGSIDVDPSCVGPRHAVFESKSDTFLLACQTSSSLLAIPVTKDGALSPSLAPAVSTLTDQILSSESHSQRADHYAVSAILLVPDQDLLFVANRQMNPPYDSDDTLAVFRPSSPTRRIGHVNLGCGQPRALTRLDAEHIAVACGGGGAGGAGLVILRMNGGITVVDRWDSGVAVWGIA